VTARKIKGNEIQMATLIKRNNGVFYIVTCEEGKRRWISLATRVDKEAQDFFANYQAEHPSRRVASVQDLWDSLEVSIKIAHSGPTYLLYEHALRNFIATIGNKPIKLLVVRDFEHYKLKRVQHIAPVTVNKELRTLRAFFNDAIRLGYITTNPCNGLSLLKVPKKVPRFLHADEVRLLLEKSASQELRSIILLAVLTGMRIGEIVTLEWSDIDVARREIWIDNKPEFQVKGGAERVVPIHDLVLQMLQAKPRTCPWVFTNAHGNKCAVGNISRRFKLLTRKVGLPEEVHFHSLRHTSLTWLLCAGTPSEFVRQIAGHASITTTQIYLHSSPQHLLTAVNSLGI
jgi:integrase